MSDDNVFVNAFERLRLAHLTFRRAEPEEVRELEAMRLEVLKVQATVPSPADSESVAAIQLRVMERAFYVLRLMHFANAPDNHGWMNQFRAWGADARFNEHYDVLKRTLTPHFRTFYEAYVRRRPYTMEQRPIHHPWQKQLGDDGEGLFMDTGRTPSVPSGAAGVDDSKGRAGADQTYEQSSSTPGDDGSSVPNE